jgi:phosphoglycerate-specific signal transduction histidine kinase
MPTMVASSTKESGTAFAAGEQAGAPEPPLSRAPNGGSMPSQTVVRRIENLEQRVTALEELPGRLDVLGEQILQLRSEMHGEFSALRAEMRSGDEESIRALRDEIRAGDEETRGVLRDEIRAGDEETRRVLRDEIRAGDEETRHVLRDEIRAGDQRILNQARVLHEEIIARLALIEESRPRRRKPRS